MGLSVSPCVGQGSVFLFPFVSLSALSFSLFLFSPHGIQDCSVYMTTSRGAVLTLGHTSVQENLFSDWVEAGWAVFQGVG